MEFGKTTFQSEVSTNKRVSKTDNFEAIWTKETNNKPTQEANEATRETWHVLRIESFKNLGR
ncbi:hypothetical protein HC02_17380 [Vibrio parahaemolyticus]|nr:hypothetical protein HC02_17380 [Vibrio parahaemolyticus]